MTAALHDLTPTATRAPRLRVVADPAAEVGTGSRRYDAAGDPLIDGAARLLCVPLRQLYAALWRVGVLEVGA